MKIRIPLFLKIMTPLIVVLILTVGLSGYRVYEESTRRWQSEMDTRLERIATLVASTVNTATLRSVREPADIDSPQYQEVKKQLDQALNAGTLNWVGIYYQEGAHFYYWIDTDSTGVGYPFFYATPEHFAAYEDRQPHRVRYADEFGSYYGFVAPIVVPGEDGPQVLGLVEAVVAEEAANLLRRDTLNRVLPILVVGSLGAVGISLLLTVVLFNRPLRRLQRGALTLADGQFGHTIDLRSNDELGDLANTFNQMSTQLEQLYREWAEKERMQREMEIARTVQQALFPTELPQVAGLEMAALCRPYRETSGDFYDLLALNDGRLGIVVGDVSGKSIPAAMLMVAAHNTIRSEAFDHASPALVLNESNALLCSDVPPGMFVAASYARLDIQTREMVWANAGQIYPFLLHHLRPVAAQDYPYYLETTGAALPLGTDDDIRYNEQCQSLLPGDTVLFYTDGVVEAMNPARELYGFQRLESLVRSLSELSPQELIDAVLADVLAFVGPAEQHDDITLVAVKIAGEP
jgi:serine phosphatase RsbU (regulator of sigma subunit)